MHHPEYGQDCSDLAGQGGLGDNLLNNVDCVRVFYGTNRIVLADDTGVDGETDTQDVLPKPGDELMLGRAMSGYLNWLGTAAHASLAIRQC